MNWNNEQTCSNAVIERMKRVLVRWLWDILDARPYSWELIRSDRIWFVFISSYVKREEERKREGARGKGSRGERNRKWNLGDTGSMMFRGWPETRKPFFDPSARKCGRVPRQDVFRCSLPTNVYPEHNYSITITITITMLLRLPLPLAHYHRGPFVPELSITLGNRMRASALSPKKATKYWS